MIKLNAKDVIKENKIEKSKNINETINEDLEATIRPDVVDAKVYKLKSAFVKNSVFITLSYINTDDKIRPIEIFINSKDLTKTSEYVILTRLISAIFRKGTNPMFILEELQGIYDPNGGSYKEGKYYHSFYSEIADVIEKFFYDVNILSKKKITLKSTTPNQNVSALESERQETFSVDFNMDFKICPTCSSKSLKTENGCDTCVECGYSKCDK